MKLSNLSLAVLVALGVAACGGSDDNNNAPQDPPPGNGGGNNGGGNTTPPPANDDKPQDPTRVAPGTGVEPQVADLVKARKITYADNGARDLLTGYAPDDGVVSAGLDPYTSIAPHFVGTNYEDNATDAANVKRLSSRVNYAEAGHFYTNSTTPNHNGAVIANAGYTYALGSDKKWHRMKPETDDWTTTTPETKYLPVNNAENGKFPTGGIAQELLFYIPNVVDGPVVAETAGTATGKVGGKLVIDPANQSQANDDFDLTKGRVQFTTAEFLGKSYDISTVGKIEKVDLNVIPVDKSKVQYHDVKINFNILDNKLTDNFADDTSVAKDAKAGAMKAYNLPYSLAFVTVNQAGAENKRYDSTDGVKSRARNLFDYSNRANAGDWGAYQVKGFQSTALPRNGRADYVGKSFGVDSVGDIHLRADFSTNGAQIGGSVINRTRADGKQELPNIDLTNIILSDNAGKNHTGTTGFGANKATPGIATSRSASGNWEVQFFGPNAEEAGGAITLNSDVIMPGQREVFTSQRGVLTDASNIAPTP